MSVQVESRLPNRDDYSLFLKIYMPDDAIIVAPIIVNRSGISL